jgi:hypothetical protein
VQGGDNLPHVVDIPSVRRGYPRGEENGPNVRAAVAGRRRGADRGRGHEVSGGYSGRRTNQPAWTRTVKKEALGSPGFPPGSRPLDGSAEALRRALSASEGMRIVLADSIKIIKTTRDSRRGATPDGVPLRRFAARDRAVFAAFKAGRGDRRRGHPQEPPRARPGEERARVRSSLIYPRIEAQDAPAVPDHEEHAGRIVAPALRPAHNGVVDPPRRRCGRRRRAVW